MIDSAAPHPAACVQRGGSFDLGVVAHMKTGGNANIAE